MFLVEKPDAQQFNNNGYDRIKILVGFHKLWDLPAERFFLPLQCGKDLSDFGLKMQGDNTGENISSKNLVFSEATMFYWAWKNIKKIYPHIEYIGFLHYRRYFNMDNNATGKNPVVLHGIPDMKYYDETFIKTLNNYDIILQEPHNLGDIDVRSQYIYGHGFASFSCAENIIRRQYPEYINSFNHIFGKTCVSFNNIFITKYKIFENYCEWLFPILFEAEKRLDFSDQQPGERRIGGLAERLLNVYVYHNKLKIDYKPIYFIERKWKINTKIKNAIKFFTPYGILELCKKIGK
jgi:hypothetical protein